MTFLGRFSLPGFNLLNEIGIVIISLICVAIIFDDLNKKLFINQKLATIGLIFFIFLIWNILSAIVNSNLFEYGSSRIITIVVVASVFISAGMIANAGLNQGKNKYLYENAFIILFLVSSPIYLFFYKYIGDDLINKNNIGMIFFCFSSVILYFDFFKNRRYIIFFIFLFYILTLLIISARSSFLGLITLLIFYFGHKFIVKNKVIYYFIFLNLCFSIFLIIFIVAFSNQNSYILRFNDLLIDLFRKRFLTGRDVMWPKLIETINENPYFGLGPAIHPGDITGFGLSAHNIYLQIGLQAGYIGLTIFLLLIFLIWHYLYNLRFTHHGKSMIAIFAGTLIINTFESTLTQNNVAYGIIFWLLSGLSIGEVIKLNQENKISN